MSRSKKPRRPGQDPPGSGPHPVTYRADPNHQAHPTDGIFNSGVGYHSTPDGGRRLWAMVGLGNGELNPMAIAAISAAISMFFVFGGCVISFHGHPGWTFAVFLLAFLQGAPAVALAFYESATRRAQAVTDLPGVQTTTAHIVVPATQRQLNTKPGNVRPPIESRPTPQPLDGG